MDDITGRDILVFAPMSKMVSSRFIDVPSEPEKSAPVSPSYPKVSY